VLEAGLFWVLRPIVMYEVVEALNLTSPRTGCVSSGPL
jgi:hypothetical protein